MKTLNPFLTRSCALALTVLLSAACAAQPANEATASSPATTASSPAATAFPEATASSPATTAFLPPAPGIVLSYEPKSPEETAAIAQIAVEEVEITPLIEKAQEEALQAIDEYDAAARSLKAPALPPGYVRATKEQVDKLHKTAEEKLAAYRAVIQKQRDRYVAFFKKYPDNWYERHLFAWFLANSHLEEDAAAEWRRVIELAPNFPYACNNLGTLYNHMGRDLEAILLYRKAIELYPNDADFYVNLAVNYSTHRAESSKQFGWDLPQTFRECILAYQRARTLKPKDPEIAYDLASQYVLAKYFDVPNTADEAIEAWKYYLALDLKP